MEFNKDTNKDGKKETNNKENKPIKMKEMSEIKPINIDIYIISCFNTYIWDKEGYNNLKSNISGVKSIKIIQKESLSYNSNFYVIIHKITLIEKLKIIDLFLTSETSEKILILNEISLNPEKELILFSNIDINQKDLKEMKGGGKEKNFVKILADKEKFKLYYEYLNNQPYFES